MSTKANSILDPRDAFRHAVRDRAMSIALEQVKSEGWNQLRINKVATGVGVSRPTIYAEFGTKEEFTQTLLDQEIKLAVNEFSNQLNSDQKSQTKSLEQAFTTLINQIQNRPIIDGLMTIDTPKASNSTNTSPYSTEKILPLINAIEKVLDEWLRKACSASPDIDSCAETLSRLVVSHTMAPVGRPSAAGKKIANLAIQILPELADT